MYDAVVRQMSNGDASSKNIAKMSERNLKSLIAIVMLTLPASTDSASVKKAKGDAMMQAVFADQSLL